MRTGLSLSSYARCAAILASWSASVSLNARRNQALAQERQDQTARALKRADARRNDPRAAYDVARVYAQQGDNDNALAWLTKALELGYDQMDFVNVDPALTALRKDPRFAKLLEERRTRGGQPR